MAWNKHKQRDKLFLFFCLTSLFGRGWGRRRGRLSSGRCSSGSPGREGWKTPSWGRATAPSWLSSLQGENIAVHREGFPQKKYKKWTVGRPLLLEEEQMYFFIKKIFYLAALSSFISQVVGCFFFVCVSVLHLHTSPGKCVPNVIQHLTSLWLGYYVTEIRCLHVSFKSFRGEKVFLKPIIGV